MYSEFIHNAKLDRHVYVTQLIEQHYFACDLYNTVRPWSEGQVIYGANAVTLSCGMRDIRTRFVLAPKSKALIDCSRTFEMNPRAHGNLIRFLVEWSK